MPQQRRNQCKTQGQQGACLPRRRTRKQDRAGLTPRNQCPHGWESEIAPPRPRMHDPLYGSETKLAHSSYATEGNPIPIKPFPEDKCSSRPADHRTHRGPEDPSLGPGLTQDCLMNYTSLRIDVFRTSQDTGFFDCQGLRGNILFPRIRRPVLHATGGSMFCGAPRRGAPQLHVQCTTDPCCAPRSTKHSG